MIKLKSKKKYDKPISLYLLKPEAALSAFMKVDPKKIAAAGKKIKIQNKISVWRARESRVRQPQSW